MSAGVRLLVVEDEVPIQELLRYCLEQSGFAVAVVGSAEEAMAAIQRELPTLVLLDLMLPGMSGPALARRLRSEARTRDLPLIMVTARAEESDRVQGLEIGADDYVTKPFSPRELAARIKAVLRRRAPHKAGEALSFGILRLDPSRREAFVGEQAASLGPTEFDLLHYLMAHPNRVQSRDQLLDALRGDHTFIEARSIDTYVRRLRAGLGPDGAVFVQTVRALGYKLAEPAP